MKFLGLIGYPLTHSFSVDYFAEKFKDLGITDYEYRNYPIKQIGELKTVLEDNPGLIGLNVTIPYKEDVIPYLDELDTEAWKIGAVNTIKITYQKRNRFLKGYNTDAYGFHHSLIPHLKEYHKNALILGTGGASKAIAYSLKAAGIEYKWVSRNPEKGQLSYADLCLAIMKKHLLIINTTPLGTFPDVNYFPDIPYDLLTNKHILYDLVYNPPETKFLEFGRLYKTVCVNGYQMLKLQAERSWEIWTSDSE